MMIPLWLKGALVVMLIAGACALFAHWKSGVEQSGYDRAVAEYREKESIAIKDAQDKTKFWRDAHDKIVMQSIAQDAELKRVAVRNAELLGTVGRLRDNISAAASRLPRNSVEACGSSLTAVSSILGQCVGEVEDLGRTYAEMATRADEHALDATVMSGAYPR